MVERDGNSWELPDELTKILPQSIQNRIVLVSDKLFPQIVNSNLEVRTSVAINPATGAAEEGALFTYEALPRTTFLWFDVVVDDFRGSFPSSEKLGEWENILNYGNKEEQKDLLKKWKLWNDEETGKKIENAVEETKSWINEEKQGWPAMNCQENNEDVLCVVKSGLEWAEYLGIGGMGTRGFGRIKVKYTEEVKNE